MSAADPRDRSAAIERARDPVCGMSIDPARTPHRTEHEGQSYFFCGARCRERFMAEPARYVSEKPGQEPAGGAAGVQWTCPMHPEIVRDGPGACPICGMALEPMTVALEEEANPELIDMTCMIRLRRMNNMFPISTSDFFKRII